MKIAVHFRKKQTNNNNRNSKSCTKQLPHLIQEVCDLQITGTVFWSRNYTICYPLTYRSFFKSLWCETSECYSTVPDVNHSKMYLHCWNVRGLQWICAPLLSIIKNKQINKTMSNLLLYQTYPMFINSMFLWANKDMSLAVLGMLLNLSKN